jgi:predicted nucleotidyltransferase
MVDDARRRAIAFAERLASHCASALGDQVVAALLHGSLTLGGFAPGRSDVDLLVVVERPLADQEIDALRQALDSLRGEVPSRVDLRVVTRAVAASASPAPPMEAYFALQPGRPATIETRVAEEPDLVVELSIVRAHGRSILGPDPRDVVGPVPDRSVLAVGDRQLAAWERLADDAAHAELMVLTTCRVWRFAVEGVHCSKAEAGCWALARDPSLSAVEQALRRRGGDPEATVDADGIRRLIAVVRREIALR